MKTKITILILSLVVLMGCGKQQENTNGLEDLKQNQSAHSEEIVQSVSYIDSINKLSAQINELKNTQLSKQQQIEWLGKKKDSVLSLLNQVQNSLEQVNAKKIAPGIEGVNTKLTELKGQRENAFEQIGLQKQEVALADKKISLLKEEKIVYDAQHQALWNKGSEPAAFKVVDSLLAGINAKITEQVLKAKSLKSTITDIDEQIVSIDEQSKSLSNKIRNNYTAKQIFDDYSKEEQERLQGQLKTINGQLETFISDDNSIGNLLAVQNSKKNSFENEESSSKELAKLNEQKKNIEANAQIANAQKESNDNKKNSKKSFAIVIVAALAALFILFFFVGKIRKSRRQKQ